MPPEELAMPGCSGMKTGSHLAFDLNMIIEPRHSSVRTEKLFGDKPSRAIVGGQLLAMEPRYSDPFKVRPRVLRAILY